MPGSQHGPSILNAKVYEALRRKGMSKRRAAMISNAQRHKASGATGLAIPPTGPNALFNSPGIGNIRARRKKTKASAEGTAPGGAGGSGYGAKVGQTIRGRLVRGAGGRFASSGGAAAKPKGRKHKPARTAEQRAAERAAKKAENAAKTFDALGLPEDAADSLTRLAAGEAVDDDGGLVKMGLAEQADDGSYRLTPAGRAVMKAAERGDLGAARDAKSRAADRAAKRAAADAEAAQPKAGGGGGGGKKKPTPDEKKAEQDKQKAANRAKTAPQAGLSTAEAEFLAGAASGTLPPGSFDAKHLTDLGLVEDTGDTTEATDAGRRALAALERGDVRGALAAIQDGKAKVARDAERGDRQRQRDEDKRKREQERERTRRRPQSGPPLSQRGTIGPKRGDTRTDTRTDTTKPVPVDRAANRRAASSIIRNLERRRARRRRKETYGGTKRSDLETSVFAGPDRSFPIKTAQDVRDAVRSLGRTKHDKSAVRRGIIRRARAIGATSALPESWKTAKSHQPEYAAPGLRALRRPLDADGSASIPQSFSVFKGADGRDRWLAITTTAYQDKDAEWITRKAIRSVVAAGDAGAPRGPLRYWHVPGLDLGDCDYQASAFGDRVLIESGTFRSKAAARIGKAAADRGYQMSPGFLHTRQEPRGGAFDHIALFERSFVPPGRASNPYTQFLTKEARMLTKEKRDEFAALAADPEARQLLETLLSQAETTVKELDNQGAVYKDAPAWAQALIARIDTLEATVKAPMPPAEMIEAGDDEADDGAADLEAETMDDGLGGALDDEGFADLLVQKLVAALGPMLELEKKMTGYLGEMKAMLAPQAQKDDARAKELADLQAVNVALDKRLKELEGDAPRAARQHYASGVWEGLTGVSITKEQAAQITAKPPTEAPAGLTAQEQGAYALIFGEG